MVLLVSVGIGVALHVSSMFLEIVWVILSICVHACCHWSCVRLSLDNRVVNSLSWIAFSSKNLVLKFSSLHCGIGFRILVDRGIESCVIRAIKVLGGISRIIGKWSEFRFCSWIVLDVYVAAYCVFV